MCDFSVELLRQSPSPALRACCELAQVCVCSVWVRGRGGGGWLALMGGIASLGGYMSAIWYPAAPPHPPFVLLPIHPPTRMHRRIAPVHCTAPRASLPPPQLHPTMARELFAPGFVSCWSELDGHLQQQLVRRWELQGSYRYRGSWPETPAVAGQKVGVA